MSNKEQLGIINEIGDLGLGFTPLSKEDNEKIKNQEKKNEDKNKKDK